MEEKQTNKTESVAEWVEEQDYMGFHVCSLCGYKTAILYHRCPNCGRSMRGGDGREIDS